jgi:hypothetical protein
MTTAHRRQRAWETQRAVAGYLATNGWPFATDVGAGRPGCDILGVPGISIEVKARRDFSPLAWVRQAGKQAGVPVCVHRPDGMGPATVAQWPVTMRLEDLVTLLRQAGYGSPIGSLPDTNEVLVVESGQ